MKGLMAKLKGMKFKELLITHGEKIVLGTVGLIVVLAISSTQWTGYTKHPEDLLEKAATAGAKLTTGEWPADKANSFQPSTYQTTALNMFTKLNNPDAMSEYSYGTPMSFPLYARQEPRAEVVWPTVQRPLADSDQMVLGITVTPEFVEAEGQGEDALGGPKIPAGAGTGAFPTGGPGAGGPAAMAEMMTKMQGGAGMSSAGGTGLQPRGQRYVAVRGIVNLFEIGQAIQKAAHLESLADGIAAIEVIDFKIQRQKAVAGPDPWPESTWQDVSLERADEVLEESGMAADIVHSGVTDPVFTMPLPSRLDGDYSEKIVSHPDLKNFQLTPEQRKLEQQLNSVILDAAGELGIEEQATKRRGFLKNQVDINSMRTSVLNNPDANLSDRLTKAKIPGMAGGAGAGGMNPAAMMMITTGRGGGGGMPPGMGGAAGMAGRGGMMPPGMAGAAGRGGMMPPGMGGAAAMAGRGGMMPPGMAGAAGRGGMMPPGMGGMGMGAGGAGGGVGGSAVGYAMLFRFLDFDVNPGEAYRYRIQLEFTNPNYGMSLDKVKEAKVAEGESRLSDWSEPTAPVVVKPDTNFYLAKVDKKPRSRGEAEFQIFQWDPALGTYIDSKKLVAKFGQFVGGLEESDRLDLGTPALEQKTVLFATKAFLLDTVVPPTLIPAENPDLNLPVTGRQAKEGLDLPAEAAVLDEYGQLKTLDSQSQRADVIEEEKKVKKEREPFESLRDSGTADTNKMNQLDGAAGAGANPMMMMQMMQMGGATSNLKRGAKNKNAGGYPGGAAGGMEPGGNRRKKKDVGG